MDTSVDGSSSALYAEDSGNDTNADDLLKEPQEAYTDSISHPKNGFITLSMNCTISSHRWELYLFLLFLELRYSS